MGREKILSHRLNLEDLGKICPFAVQIFILVLFSNHCTRRCSCVLAEDHCSFAVEAMFLSKLSLQKHCALKARMCALVSVSFVNSDWCASCRAPCMCVCVDTALP